MNFTLFLRKIMTKYVETTDSLFSISVLEHEKYLNSFSEPKNDFERSFYQYKCSMFRMSNLHRFMVNLAGAILYIPYLFKLKSNSFGFIKKYDAVFMTDGISMDTVPTSLKIQYPNIIQSSFGIKMSLKKEDITFLKVILKDCRFNYYFKLKLLMKIGMYSTLIEKYNPKAIISYTESSFTSSILTKYCEDKGIENISIMHGERIFNLKTSFFRFSRYYLWDIYYIDLMTKLRCFHNQYIVEVPVSITSNNIKSTSEPKYFMTYYLEEEDEKSLLLIRNAVEILENKNKKCSIRIHPRGHNKEIVYKILNGFNIQTVQDTTLKESLENTEHIASVVSTVLFEGWYSGKKVIIDDYSQKSYYEKLKELDYIMLTKPHLLLSEVILMD